jgi:hypothetical protein
MLSLIRGPIDRNEGIMRRIVLVVLLGITTLSLSAGVAVAKPKPKPATFKVGTYAGKLGAEKFSISLKRAKCAGKLQFCVSLAVAPQNVECQGSVPTSAPVGPFVAPVALPASGKLTQQAPVSAAPAFPGGAPTTGHSGFSVAFTKKGTATGHFELSETLAVGVASLPCTGTTSFTAKLG